MKGHSPHQHVLAFYRTIDGPLYGGVQAHRLGGLTLGADAAFGFDTQIRGAIKKIAQFNAPRDSRVDLHVADRGI